MNENNFEALRQLLALKRHEVPPPGYFENFSGQVMAQIRMGQHRQSEARAVELPWLFRLLAAFESKPAYAGGFASALCSLLLFGIVYAERPDTAMQPLLLTASTGGTFSLATAKPADQNSQQAEVTSAQLPFTSSTNPVFNVESAPWMAVSQPASAQLVNFKFQ